MNQGGLRPEETREGVKERLTGNEAAEEKERPRCVSPGISIELVLNRFTELDVRDHRHLLHHSEDWKATPLARPPEPDTRPWWTGRRRGSGRRVRSADPPRRPGPQSSAPSVSSVPAASPPPGRRQSSTISVLVFTAPRKTWPRESRTFGRNLKIMPNRRMVTTRETDRSSPAARSSGMGSHASADRTRALSTMEARKETRRRKPITRTMPNEIRRVRANESNPLGEGFGRTSQVQFRAACI